MSVRRLRYGSKSKFVAGRKKQKGKPKTTQAWVSPASEREQKKTSTSNSPTKREREREKKKNKQT